MLHHTYSTLPVLCSECSYRSVLIRRARSSNAPISPCCCCCCSSLQSYQRVSSRSRVFWKQVFGKIDKLPTSKAVKGLGCICFLPQTDAADLSLATPGNTKGQKEIRVPLSKEKNRKKKNTNTLKQHRGLLALPLLMKHVAVFVMSLCE